MQTTARCLTYPGDVARTVLGQVMGPNTYDELVLAVAAGYDPARDVTRVQFRYLRPEELELCRRDGAFVRLPGEYELIEPTA